MASKIPSYNDAELLELLDNIESDRVERKRSFKNDAERARQAVCAFANDLPNHNQPGILFIGAEDNGSPSNTTVDDELLRSLADIRDDGNILPMPVLNVEKRVLIGIQTAKNAMIKNGNPEPEFNCNESIVLCILRAKS